MTAADLDPVALDRLAARARRVLSGPHGHAVTPNWRDPKQAYELTLTGPDVKDWNIGRIYGSDPTAQAWTDYIAAMDPELILALIASAQQRNAP